MAASWYVLCNRTGRAVGSGGGGVHDGVDCVCGNLLCDQLLPPRVFFGARYVPPQGNTTVFIGNDICEQIEYYSSDIQITCMTPPHAVATTVRV